LFKKYTNNNIEIEKVDGVVTNKSFADTRQEINYQLRIYDEMIRDMILLTKNERKFMVITICKDNLLHPKLESKNL
jgi:hypothetical protein